jgi:hypothetical protein
MSNKQETPVRWLFEEMQKTYIFNQDDFDMFKKALQMESKKQQKYDEMLGMLESCVLAWMQMGMKEPVGITQLIKEAKEL